MVTGNKGRHAVGLVAGVVLACLAGQGCERHVPALRRMPRPPAELLVVVPPTTYAGLSHGIREAAADLPSNPAYVEAATGMESGRPVGEVELEWYATALDGAVQSIRKVLPRGAGGWPSEAGGPELLPTEVRGLGSAFAVCAAYEMTQGHGARALALCVDGLRLAAYVGMGAGPEADAAAASAERPVLAQLRRLVASALLAPRDLAVGASALEQQVSHVRPLKLALQEGLSIAAAAQQATLPEEWSAAVRSTWRTQPQIVPAQSLRHAWEMWGTLIHAAEAPAAEARELAESVGPVTDSIQLLYAPPAAGIIAARATRMQTMQRLRLEFALARRRAAQGEYPDSLSQLVPAYMQKLPSDELTGAVFAYRREGSAYALELAGARGR